MGFAVKYFETITASIVNWFSGNNNSVTDFNVGSRLRTMFEAVAIEMEQIYYQLYVGIKNGIATAVFNSFNFPLLQPQAASGSVTFSRTTPAPVGGITIPAGTQVSTQGTSSSPAVTYQTVDTVVIPAGQLSVSALVVATVTGTVGNAQAGLINTLVGTPTGVNSVTNPNAFFTGTDLETEDQRLARFQKFIANLSRGTLGAIENAALGVVNIVDAVAIESPKLSVFIFNSVFQTFTDISFEANIPGGTPQQTTTSAPSTGDALYVGAANRFNTIKFTLDQGMIGGQFNWEYWNGSAWVTLPFTADSTAYLTNTGFLTFSTPSDWRDTVINGVRRFWIRLRITGTSPAVTHGATLVQAQASPFNGVVEVVAMDASSTLSPTLQANVAAQMDSYRAAGIHVTVVGPTVTTVNVTASIVANPLADTTALETQLQQAISDFINSFTLGQELILSQLIQFIRNQSTDVIDVQITTPTDSLYASFDEILKPGTISVLIQ